MSRTGILATTVLAAGLLAMPVANAQGPSPSGPSTTTDKPTTGDKPATGPTTGKSKKSADIPDGKLDAAAAAVKRVLTLKDTYEQKLARAPDNEKEGVIQEANNAVTKAVTDQGLSLEEFNDIMEVAENDPVVREKLVKRMK